MKDLKMPDVGGIVIKRESSEIGELSILCKEVAVRISTSDKESTISLQ